MRVDIVRKQLGFRRFFGFYRLSLLLAVLLDLWNNWLSANWSAMVIEEAFTALMRVVVGAFGFATIVVECHTEFRSFLVVSIVAILVLPGSAFMVNGRGRSGFGFRPFGDALSNMGLRSDNARIVKGQPPGGQVLIRSGSDSTIILDISVYFVVLVIDGVARDLDVFLPIASRCR